MPTLWLDPTNSPHVLIIRPLLREFDKKGVSWFVTTRDYAQTIPLLERFGIPYILVGGYAKGSKVKKGLYAIYRSLRLLRFSADAVFSPGSPYVYPSAITRRIPVIFTQDNEHISLLRWIGMFSHSVVYPEAVPEDLLVSKGVPRDKIVQYPGLKEEIYLYDWEIDLDAVRHELGIEKGEEVVAFRPEPYTAHYLQKKHEWSLKFVESLLNETDYRVVVLPRTAEQKEEYLSRFGEKIIIPERPVDGPSLLKLCSLFISAGGTMAREAVVLGTPSISMYPGELLSVDRWLIDEGYLIHNVAPTVEDVHEAINDKKRYRMTLKPRKTVLNTIFAVLGV